MKKSLAIKHGRRYLFLKAASNKFQRSWNTPWAVTISAEQAEKEIVAAENFFWGYPELNFRAKLPFHEMMSAYAAF